MELGDVFDHVAARAELRMHGHAGVGLLERRDLRRERRRQRPGAEHDQRAVAVRDELELDPVLLGHCCRTPAATTSTRHAAMASPARRSLRLMTVLHLYYYRT